MDLYFQNRIAGSIRQHPAQQLVNALVGHGTFEVQEPRWQHFAVLAWIGIPFTSSANVCGRRLGFDTMKRDLSSAQFVVDYDIFGDRGQKLHLRLFN